MTETHLIDDCFRPSSERLRHDEAIALLKARLTPLASREMVPLAEAAGRVLAAPARAGHAVPAHTNSAVDGYAFAAASYDRAAGAELVLAGRAAAGSAFGGAAGPGEAVRILTGAVMPEGCDTVAMQEDVALVPGDAVARVRIPPGLKAGANVRRAGEDVAAGAELVPAGTLLRPQDLAALASIGAAQVDCYRRLRVAIVSTGDEVIRPGAAPLLRGQVFDANAPMLFSLVQNAGAEPVDLGVWPDRQELVRERLAATAHEVDVILTSGGASRGEEDHMSAALAALGTRHFWQIAIKPGRPMMLGQIGRTLVAGLPGNPVAVFVCFLMYVHPILRVLAGAPWPEPRRFQLPAAFSFPGRKKGRREFWRGMIVERDGAMAVDKFARDGSGLISGLRAADGLIDIPEDAGDVAPGDRVAYIPFSEFGILGR
jgi:molybdopterin molybdotransferase